MRFIETVLITDKINNLAYHNMRMNKTRKDFFNLPAIDLGEYLTLKKNTRARIVYEKEIVKIEYFELTQRNFSSFKLVESDINYEYKFEDRKELEKLKRPGYDEVIIVKNGLVTDTTISNLAFYDGKEWHTPEKPLLKGTKREELLDKGFLKEKEIYADELHKYEKFAMLNAVLGFYERSIECISF